MNLEDGNGLTPLGLAACYGNVEVVKLLLDTDSDTEPKESTGRTPLLCAAANGRVEVVTLLLATDKLRTKWGTYRSLCQPGAAMWKLWSCCWARMRISNPRTAKEGNRCLGHLTMYMPEF